MNTASIKYLALRSLENSWILSRASLESDMVDRLRKWHGGGTLNHNQSFIKTINYLHEIFLYIKSSTLMHDQWQHLIDLTFLHALHFRQIKLKLPTVENNCCIARISVGICKDNYLDILTEHDRFTLDSCNDADSNVSCFVPFSV